MSSVNKVILLGRLGKDPEVRRTQDGKAIASLSLATSETWKDQAGNKQERTEWHRVVVFGGMAEVIEKYLNKGDQVYFEGMLTTRKWQDQQGNDRYSTEVKVDSFNGSMTLLGGNRNGGQAPHPADQYQQDAQAAQAKPEGAPFDDEIPF